MRTILIGTILASLLMASCGAEPPRSARLRFAVVDVGQGLAQIGTSGTSAVAWDLGLPSGMTAWRAAYEYLGAPRLAAIAISHSDWDHCGGLSVLPDSLDFTGAVIVHAGEDTAYLRAQASAAWSNRLWFRTLTPGDTLGGLSDVVITCLWPAGGLGIDSLRDSSPMRNRYSFVWSVVLGSTRLLIPSDVDTVAEAALSRDYGEDLRAQVAIVPHHGSASAVDPVFWGFVHPATAVVSCEQPPNQYGHPSSEFLDLMFQMGVEVRATYQEGTVWLESNGEYWDFGL